MTTATLSPKQHASSLGGGISRRPRHTKPGECVIQVNPKARRCGIGMLLLEIMDAYFPIDFTIQRYTAAGRALAARYLSTKAGTTHGA